MNTFKTGLLLALLTAIFMAVGYVIGGQSGMLIAFVVALATNVFAFWKSDKMVLKMHGAVEVDETSAPEYYGIVRQLVDNAGLPMPRVYVMQNPQPNAFATGRNPEHAAVAATTGLLDILTKEEVAAVMAHELAHVKNRDTLIMTIAATIGGAISMLANFGLWFGGGRNSGAGRIGAIAMAILAPFAAMIVQMAISRAREYQADRLGAEICNRPLWLASALRKIADAARGVVNERAEANPATAHMFIINPLSGRGLGGLFSTHPPAESRIDELVELAAEWGQIEGSPGAGRNENPSDDRDNTPTGHDRGPWN